MNCKFCNRHISNSGSLTAHEMCCKNNPNRVKHKRSSKAGQKLGCVPWNKNKKFDKKSIEYLIHKIETGEYKNQCDGNIRRSVRLYLIHKYGHSCMLCGLSEWQGYPIPLVCDHIDGDHSNIDLDNFRIICNNCDSILPTFKGKNRGKGRGNRYKNPSSSA